MTKKSLSKRIKVTGKGKFLRRKTHQNHFNAKETGKQTRQKRSNFVISGSDQKTIKSLMS